MLQEKDLKRGVCIVEQTDNLYREGVIMYINSFYDCEKNCKKICYDILWFIRNIKDNTFFTEYDRVSFNQICDLDLAIIPHFCSINNLYFVLKRYTELGAFKGVSVSKTYYDNYYDDKEENPKNTFLHLKTIQNTFIEIVIHDPTSLFEDYENPYVWVNEFDSVNELSLNSDLYGNYSKNVSLIELSNNNLGEIENLLFDFDKYNQITITGVGFSSDFITEIIICDFKTEDERITFGNGVILEEIFEDELYKDYVDVFNFLKNL